MMPLDPLRIELSDPLLEGPTLVPSEFVLREDIPHLRHIGFDLMLSTRSNEMQLPIFLHDWWRYDCIENLLVPPVKIPFSFDTTAGYCQTVEGLLFVNLWAIIKQIYDCAAYARDILDFLSELQNFMPRRGRAPLKSDASEFVAPELARLGFAVGAIRAQKGNIVVRLVWIFPNQRNRPQREHYLSAGSLRLVEREGDIFAGAEWLPRTWYGVTGNLTDRIRKVVGEELPSVLSPKGRERVTDVFFWRHGVKSPRRRKREQCVVFVRTHPELWNDPAQLARLMQEEGLYSRKRYVSDVAWSCKGIIEELAEPPEGREEDPNKSTDDDSQ